jgi:predicted Zn finger-like uncharacterized protein
MPVRISCPMCKSTYVVNDDVRGKQIRCKDCGKLIGVPPAKPAAAEEAIAPAGTKPAPARPSGAVRRPVIRQDEAAQPPKRSKAPLLLGLGCFALVALLLVCGGGGAVAFLLLQPGETKAVSKANDDAARGAVGPRDDNGQGEAASTKDTASTSKDFPKTFKEYPLPKPPVAAGGGTPSPVSGQLDPQVLAKVKNATVHMRVTMSNGAIGQGSGFFGVESGLVLTNAHVLGMLNDDDPPPKRVDITYHSGEPDSRSFVGQILGVDRSSDLAVLRVQGANLPEPLTVKSSTGLVETQTVYIVGFPFGDQLGKNITVSQTSVSSLRKSADGIINKVQVNGGMHPGNSGGPVINTSGEVVGVAVSGIQGTQIHFAVPGEYVGVAMNGRVTTISGGATVKDGDQIKMKIIVGVLDPLKRVQKMELEWWIGPPGPGRGPSAVAPQPKPGDSPHQLVTMNYKPGRAEYDIVVSPEVVGKPGQLVWAQPVITNGLGEQRWVGTASYVASAPLPPVERIAADLTLKHVWGARPVKVTSTSTITTSKPGSKAETESFKMVTDLTETMTSEQRGLAALRTRYQNFTITYPKTTFTPEEREQLKKALNQITLLHANLLVDTQNNLKKNEVDPGVVAKAPLEIRRYMQFMHSQVTDSLETLWVPLPGRVCQPGESWKANRPLIVPIIGDMPMDLTFTYQGVRPRDGRPEAVITLRGVAREKAGKYQIKGDVNGFVFLELANSQISFANISGQLEISGGTAGKFTAKLDSRMERTLGKELLNVRDQLTKNDPVDSKMCPYKVHLVQLEAGKPAVISMESFNGPDFFDTFLRLEDMSGKVLAFDDDKGVDLNSLVVFTPPTTGQYKIVATCYKPALGNYMLVVRQSGLDADAASMKTAEPPPPKTAEAPKPADVTPPKTNDPPPPKTAETPSNPPAKIGGLDSVKPDTEPKAKAKAAASAVTITPEKNEIVLSSTIQDTCAAAGGTKIVVHLLKEERLAVIDLKEGKEVASIPAKGSSVFFAAGKKHLLLALPESKVLESWSLDKVAKVQSKPLPGGHVKGLAMGASSSGPALFVLANSTNPLEKLTFTWLDPTSLTTTPVKVESGFLPFSYRDQIHLRAAADGSLFGIWLSGQNPTGVGCLLYAKPNARYYKAHESAGDVLPSANGKFLCTGGGLYNTEAKMIDANLGWCVPSLEGDYFVSFGKRNPADRDPKALHGQVMVYGKSAAIGTVDIENVAADYFTPGNGFTFDKHFFFVPESGYLVTLPRFNDRLVVQQVKLGAAK